MKKNRQESLYDPHFEHDNCGIGAVVSIDGTKSHANVDKALKIVENLEHRAGKDAEGKTGDGVGILVQISHRFFSKEAAKFNIKIGGEREYGIAMFFFPQNSLERLTAKKIFEHIVKKEGLEFLGWRKVPVYPEILGSAALACMPCIEQAFIAKPKSVEKGIDFDRRLYVLRRAFEQSNEDKTYVVSCSSRTIVYKGMFLVGELRNFYADLQDEDYESAIALVHSRYSTNTHPSWERAHPNRFIVHNGEINTIRGNVDKMLAREEKMKSGKLRDDMSKVTPIINTNGSDSSMLDNAIEFLVMSGMELPLAIAVCIPEPWMNNKYLSMDKKAFYEYYASMMEPWDGPASILFSDGDILGAVLDRNGLRPSRYYLLENELILSSEVGVLDIDESKIQKKGVLGPANIIIVDTVNGAVRFDDEIKSEFASRHPYGEWLDENLVHLDDIHIPNKNIIKYDHEERAKLQKAFGYTYEDYTNAIIPMAANGVEATASMGCDSPIPPLTDCNIPLFSYFKQLFAQVTNPPIDSIREEIVTSTAVYLGNSGDLLECKASNCRMFRINNPILTATDMLRIRSMKVKGLKSTVIPIIHYKNTSLEKAVEQLSILADEAIKNGSSILILSDRGVDETHVAIPSLLAVSALQQYLVRTRRRTSVSLILESGEPRDVPHFALLMGFGASSIYPYLAHETIRQAIHEKMLSKDWYAAVDDFNSAILHGIVKIASKMGISTLQSYMGSKIFEAIGISDEVINKYFTGTVSRVGGISLKDIEKMYDRLHNKAFDPLGLECDLTLDNPGLQKFRSGNEKHLYNPETIHLLQQSTQKGDYELFKKYTDAVNRESEGIHLRGMLEIRESSHSIPIDEVESASEIVKRFKTGAMSYGSISQEAHETLAIAMNRLGGKSNSGEGGERPERLATKGSDTDRCSAIKQVASGRFGVTSEYLVSAKEIQIKMAQGAKPGEGGHLPGSKVYPWIAETRYSTPGVALISPPPHHDIYSIEDLAQLIYDLKNANTKADVSVKLVSEAGVGTVASGVAKAGAATILISGYDGGTGAAPRTSIPGTGLPWELGVAEAHQSLVYNNLRSRVHIETDGKLMSGRDVVIAAMLGADEFGFATAPLVTMGCVMMRVCNLDTCPVGIATQNPELRKRFRGKPEYVENFMLFIAREIREYMAALGIRKFDELVGRTDLLKVSDRANERGIHLSGLLGKTEIGGKTAYNAKNKYNFELDKTLDAKVLIKKIIPSVKAGRKITVSVPVGNTDRTTGTMLGSEITRICGTSLAEDSVVVNCTGHAGQSFGAFIPSGLTMKITGDTNDYFGKGLSGGKLIAVPPENAGFVPEENIITGNVALYGATGGKAFIYGMAGQRFCVRNSGAVAVVEGCGDHGCEYMTGGRAVIIGPTGRNFAAGMSGGVAYVLDEKFDLYTKVNRTLVALEHPQHRPDIEELRGILTEYWEATGSPKARRILDNFDAYLPKFKKIIPHDYKKVMGIAAELIAEGVDEDTAKIEAFNSLRK